MVLDNYSFARLVFVCNLDPPPFCKHTRTQIVFPSPHSYSRCAHNNILMFTHCWKNLDQQFLDKNTILLLLIHDGTKKSLQLVGSCIIKSKSKTSTFQKCTYIYNRSPQSILSIHPREDDLMTFKSTWSPIKDLN